MTNRRNSKTEYGARLAVVGARPARDPEGSKGFSIVSAIFLLVVLSFLGVAMVTFSTTQNQGAAMDMMGSRAYQAARAGVEWAAFQVANSPASSPAPAGCASNFAAGTLGGTLAPFAVTVACNNPASFVEGDSTIWEYNITATATTGGAPGDPNYIQRVINVKMSR